MPEFRGTTIPATITNATLIVIAMGLVVSAHLPVTKKFVITVSIMMEIL
jgi:hypothetical protein